jgi:DNA-binding GntR family transcriptional regulator
MRVEERTLRASPELRRMVSECERLARDVKMHLVYTELKNGGYGHNQSLRSLAKRFDVSFSTVKRALRRIGEMRGSAKARLH